MENIELFANNITLNSERVSFVGSWDNSKVYMGTKVVIASHSFTESVRLRILKNWFVSPIHLFVARIEGATEPVSLGDMTKEQIASMVEKGSPSKDRATLRKEEEGEFLTKLMEAKDADELAILKNLYFVKTLECIASGGIKEFILSTNVQEDCAMGCFLSTKGVVSLKATDLKDARKRRLEASQGKISKFLKPSAIAERLGTGEEDEEEHVVVQRKADFNVEEEEDLEQEPAAATASNQSMLQVFH
jgi:hypothetical protein